MVFTSEKVSIRNDEAYEILLVENLEQRKHTKKPTRLISTSHSVGLTEPKTHVLAKVTPELLLSMFQRSTSPNGTRIRAPEKLSKGLAERLVLIKTPSTCFIL